MSAGAIGYGIGISNGMTECSKQPKCANVMKDYPGTIAFTLTAIPFSIIIFSAWLNGEFKRKK